MLSESALAVHESSQDKRQMFLASDCWRSVHSQDSLALSIDGIISLDHLGLDKVYVQAKRWQDNVGRPQIQAFFGAIDGRNATKGVFITTSDFTRDAREYAERVSGNLVLVMVNDWQN